MTMIIFFFFLSYSGIDAHLKKPRRCTDFLFLLIFVGFWIGMLSLGFYGVGTGNPKVLVFGTDYTGTMCGDGVNANRKARYFVNPAEVAFAAGLDITGSNPPKVNTGGYNLRDAKSICLPDCPAIKDDVNNGPAWVCEYPGADGITLGGATYTEADWDADNGDYYSKLTSSEQSTSLAMKGPCYPVVIPTINTFHTCTYYGSSDSQSMTWLTGQGFSKFDASSIDDAVATLSKQVDEMLTGPLDTLERYIDDFTTGWKVVLVAGAVCPIVLSIMYLFFLRYFTKVFAYTILFLVNALAIVLTIYLFLKAGVIGSDQINAYLSEVSEGAAESLTNYTDPAENNQDILKIFAYISCAVTVIFFLFTVVMLPRVKVAVGVIKVATSALGKMPSLLVFPVFPALSMVLLGVFWLITMVWLYSSGEIVMQDCDMSDASGPPKVFCRGDVNDTETCHCGYKTSFDRNLQGALAYYAFGFLWGSQWIIAVTYLILACVFVQYYFAAGEYNALKNSPLTTASKKMIWYHSGTAAVGSFFVAILQFIRVIVRFVVHRMKKLGKDSKIMKYMGYYVEYCLWYLQKCIEWLNRNAYIMTAIEGTSFCSSAWNSLSLMVKNVASVAAVSVIGDIMLFLGKLSVALGSGVIAFLMLDDKNFNYGDEKVSSPLFIVIVVCLFAFVIASVFMSIVEFGIDTIILCYCKDCDDNAGTPVNAPPALTSALGIAGKVKQQRIEAAQARAERAHAD